MIVLLFAAAFMCGLPFGFIAGLLVVWRLNKPAREHVLDYSDGY